MADILRMMEFYFFDSSQLAFFDLCKEMKKIGSIDDYMQSIPLSRQEELSWLRQVILEEVKGLEETIKWGAPVYCIKGKNVMGMAAFKSYVGLWFFQGIFLKDPYKYLVNAQEGRTKALRQWRFQNLDQMKPLKTSIIQYVNEAILNAKSELEIKPVHKLDPIVLQSEFEERLKETPVAYNYFNSLPKSHQRQYVGYIEEAKKKETRLKRVDKCILMLLERNKVNH